MERKHKESSFSRNLQNTQKLGAYYTDIGHCKRIGRLFDFDTAEEICVLEPSVGDGNAVVAVTGERKNVKLFGVELRKDTYEKHLKENKKFNMVLNEDFLRGIKVSHGVFSFVFANPPYGVFNENESGKRLELVFLEHLTRYVQTGAYVVYVIPHSTFREEKFLRTVMARYEICSFFKFDDEEYKNFHQVAVIMQKKKSGQGGYLRSDFERTYDMVSRLEEYPYLPKEDEEIKERYEVLPSYDSAIEYFTTKGFNADDALEKLNGSILYTHMSNNVFQRAYTGCDLNRPIIPVSKEISYLLAVTGGGQGLAGEEMEGTLHLQRGVVKKAEDEAVNYDDKGFAKSITATSFASIKLNIIQNNGVITSL